MYRERMDGNNMPALHIAGRFDGPPRVADSMAARAVRHPVDTLDRRLAFERAHPEVVIALPWTTTSGLWEATWPDGGHAGYDTCAMLLDHLDGVFRDEQ